jgi:hypothetical protein
LSLFAPVVIDTMRDNQTALSEGRLHRLIWLEGAGVPTK